MTQIIKETTLQVFNENPETCKLSVSVEKTLEWYQIRINVKFNETGEWESFDECFVEIPAGAESELVKLLRESLICNGGYLCKYCNGIGCNHCDNIGS